MESYSIHLEPERYINEKLDIGTPLKVNAELRNNFCTAMGHHPQLSIQNVQVTRRKLHGTLLASVSPFVHGVTDGHFGLHSWCIVSVAPPSRCLHVACVAALGMQTPAINGTLRSGAKHVCLFRE